MNPSGEREKFGSKFCVISFTLYPVNVYLFKNIHWKKALEKLAMSFMKHFIYLLYRTLKLSCIH